jgi:hypothetical protein
VADLIPIDHDPFAVPQAALVPVEHDPFAPQHPVAGPTGDLTVDIPRQVGTGAANAIAGYLSLPNTAAQGIDWLGGLVGKNPGVQSAIESIKAPGSPAPLFPDYQTAKTLAFNTTGGTEYQPSTWLGRRGMDVLGGVMSGGPAQLAISGPRAALASLPALAGASATGGQAAETFPNHPIVAGLLGAIPGAAMGNALMNAPQRVAGLAGGGTPTEPYGAFKRLDLPTNLTGTTTGQPGLLFAEKFAARMPGSEGAVGAARENLINSWQDKLNGIAGSLGPATTAQEAGTSLQGAATNWLDQFKNQQAARWGLYRTLVPESTAVPVPGFKQSLDTVLQNYGGADNLAKVLQPQLAASLKTALGKDLTPTGTLSSQAVHSIRTSLGQMLEDPQPIEGMGKAAIKQLYSGLTNDIEGEAKAAGPHAEAAFRQASDITRTGHDILDNYVAPVLQAKSPEEATRFAMAQARLGGTRLEGVTTHLPSAAGNLRSFALLNPAGETQSPTSLATALIGRRPAYSPEAQSVLFGNPAVKQQVEDLAATGNAMAPAAKDLANSPTATHTARGLGRVMAGVELARQGHELAGVPGAVAGGLLGVGAPDILGRAAQVSALNPWLAALYGNKIPMAGQSPSMLTRAFMAPVIGNQPNTLLPGPRLSAPATSASSTP